MGALAAGRRCDLALGTAVALMLSACMTIPIASTKQPRKPVTATSTVAPGRGAIVFSDDFHDSNSGWTTRTLPSGTTFAYQNGTYVIVAKGYLHHYAFSPYTPGVEQLSAKVTATTSSATSSPTGFGVGCVRGEGASEVDYELLVETDATWFVERAEGPPKPDRSPDILKQGTAPLAPGGTPLTLEGLCATLPGSATTRLVLFIAGRQVADLTDTPGALPSSGWTAELIVSSSASGQATVTVTKFVERDAAA
jgi:hypothetical protein